MIRLQSKQTWFIITRLWQRCYRTYLNKAKTTLRQGINMPGIFIHTRSHTHGVWKFQTHNRHRQTSGLAKQMGGAHAVTQAKALQ